MAHSLSQTNGWYIKIAGNKDKEYFEKVRLKSIQDGSIGIGFALMGDLT